MPHSILDVLNDLISTCRDSQEGFSKAAKGVHSDALRRLFMDIFEERGRFVTELQEHVRRLGGNAADRPHGSGPLRKGWAELETNIRPKDDSTFLSNCLEGEQLTMNHYETALAREDTDGAVRPTLEQQSRRIRGTLEELRSRQTEHQHA